MLRGSCLRDSQDMSDTILLQDFRIASGLRIGLVDALINFVDILSDGAVSLRSLVLTQLPELLL